MATRAEVLMQELQAFHRKAVAFVKNVPDGEWKKQCESEAWSINVVARHIGAGHYNVCTRLAELIVTGRPIPELSHEQIIAAGNAHADKHADCTKEEVVSVLEAKWNDLAAYVSGLSDAQLATSGDIPSFGGELSVEKLLRLIILNSAGEHLSSMQQSLAKT